ncbi:MAG: DNA/RNA non-specific endonuclease [Fimbriiglobus sp.]
MTLDELEAQIEATIAADDLETLQRLAEEYFLVKAGGLPLSVAVEFQDVSDVSPALEGQAAINLLNRASRGIRRIAYNRKLLFYKGPIIVAEGDSWFEYPVLLKDVLDHLMDKYAVYSLAGGGHLLEDMAREAEYMGIIQSERPAYFLLSGGGNDMLQGGRLAEFLKPFEAGMKAADVLDSARFDPFVEGILSTAQRILAQVHNQFPNVVMMIHGYDYALPRPNGDWLGTPLAQRKVPKNLWAEVIRIVIDKFNARLKSFESLFPGKVFHIDCRTAVGGDIKDWHDELHPTDDGYGRAAACFIERIEAIEAARHMEGNQEIAGATHRQNVMNCLAETRIGMPKMALKLQQTRTIGPNATPESEPFTEAIVDTKPTRPSPRGDQVSDAKLEAWRAKFQPEDMLAWEDYLALKQEALSPTMDQELVEKRAEFASQNDPFFIERIVGKSNLYPINYLFRGERAARAVGRVNVISKLGNNLGSGTGFLVAPGLLMTNNHVLKQQDLAAKSYVVFEFEYDADNRLKATTLFEFTSELFFTDATLDFTIVSVSEVNDTGRNLSEFGYLPLVAQTGKVLDGEYVSIIQHPGGAAKQLALRDSEILGRKRNYLYYTTDTNPGSSGAPVLSDEWLTVALHHRAVPDFNTPDSYVANRGIRISAIMDRLKTASTTNEQARTILARLEVASGTMPSTMPMPDDYMSTGANTEAMVEPFGVPLSVPRAGYNKDFLGISVPMPTIRPEHANVVAKLKGSSETVLKYEHFSIVMHAGRRLALFTASNVDAAPARKKPEPGRDYSRAGLSGLGENDREKWREDPRLDSQFQLPDRFYTKDNGAFDKGHIVRRDDAAWGFTYEELRRANGDTYFTTNCSPQVGDFNQSSKGGEWGKLENMVLKQAAAEKLCVFAGPILDSTDRTFTGKDNTGEAKVQIPVKFWKLIVAKKGTKLQSFAFLLEQDLTGVPLEFTVGPEWTQRRITVVGLEALVRFFRFPQAVRDADQFAG